MAGWWQPATRKVWCICGSRPRENPSDAWTPAIGLERLGRQAKNASFSREKRRPYERNSRLEVLTQNGRISKPKPLFAAIARETNVKGEDVRFKKTKQGNSASANRKKE